MPFQLVCYLVEVVGVAALRLPIQLRRLCHVRDRLRSLIGSGIAGANGRPRPVNQSSSWSPAPNVLSTVRSRCSINAPLAVSVWAHALVRADDDGLQGHHVGSTVCSARHPSLSKRTRRSVMSGLGCCPHALHSSRNAEQCQGCVVVRHSKATNMKGSSQVLCSIYYL